MQYINVGAYSDNQRIPTKAKLKQMVKETPELLRFDETSMYSQGCYLAISDIDHTMTLTVVGPDPYNNRKWYASVTIKNGKVHVS